MHTALLFALSDCGYLRWVYLFVPPLSRILYEVWSAILCTHTPENM